jgi:spore coat polysaccharide biosynthesis predicted glycosyltransferase SpsG
MSQHDLAITGGGLTPFEAAGAGLPCVVIANERFEIPVGQAFERLGAGRFAGYHTEFDLGMIGPSLPLASMSEAALQAVDLGGAGRVADAIWELAR